MMAVQSTERRPRILSWLAYGVIITALVTTATFSKYFSSASATGTATVAAMDMSMGSVDLSTASLKSPGDSDVLEFNVVNFTGEKVSDVTQSYTVTVSSTGNLPLSYELQCMDTVGGGVGICPQRTAISRGSVLAGGALPHTTKTTHTYALTVTWPENVADASYADEIDLITVTVNSQQAA